MALSKLIESSIKCNAELVAAVADGKDYETIKKIDENLLFLISSIRDLHVFSLHDINRQMKFFLHRSTDFDDATSSSFDIEALNCLVDRYTDAKGDLPKIGQTEKTISAQAAINLRNHKFLSDELLQEPNSRVALFNTDYIYEYSSNANARFNNAKPEDMVGKHMAEVVGRNRFENRAKRYFDKCFSGERQKYSYFLVDSNYGERLMNCQATPYRDDDGAVRGALVLIEDLSEKLQQASQSAAQNLVA